jgi:outer membrane receptor for monomeric catechols
VADDQAGFGYFRNFGRTRRQGLEAGMSGRVGKYSAGINATVLDGAFRSPEVVAAGGNSSNDAVAPGFDGTVGIKPGDHIPLTPRQIVKAFVQWDVAPRITVDGDAIYVGGSYARGNENNRHQPDGVFYLGEGSTAGYTVVNLGVDFRPSAGLTKAGACQCHRRCLESLPHGFPVATARPTADGQM